MVVPGLHAFGSTMAESCSASWTLKGQLSRAAWRLLPWKVQSGAGCDPRNPGPDRSTFPGVGLSGDPIVELPATRPPRADSKSLLGSTSGGVEWDTLGSDTTDFDGLIAI